MIESNLTMIDQTQRVVISPVQVTPDRTGLFIALFLLFLLFILISYLFYSFFSFKRFTSQRNNVQNNLFDQNFNNKIILDDNDDLINNNGEIILGRQSSFSDCGTSLRSSSIRSHINQRTKRSSSYKYCSQTSNYLLTPCLSSQMTTTGDECLPTTIIVEPHDAQLANALSRSISKYYERRRKPILKRRTHSYDDIVTQTIKKRSPLQPTVSLPIRRSLQQADKNNRQYQRQSSSRKKPTTIYELYKSDRMRISNLLSSDA
ncbi:unnamed protein product [Rotaria sp. Silwood1]|nr:unnamed protein product [Rotaria sp. Silwood1]CAF1064629.1 unnamed protein product [Rotaria sp. Silwood1]CAF3407916.1 unnamed protein product [Rotaria sp. Silwood1]CAF3432710.1 unnamed protein product [Rotaria sp. Silwood1]CAF4677065.1 unnamed protein product [Rotaria sp. Silwood1]